MEPSQPRAFPPVEAGALLAATTLVCIAIGTLVGWLAGALKIGLVVGATVGIPAGIAGVYIRYHEYFA
jgi:F0F1-type ATP synthase assembly protein I